MFVMLICSVRVCGAEELIEVRVTIPLESDGNTLVRRPIASDFSAVDPAIARWFGADLLPKDEAEWSDFGDPLTIDSFSSLLTSALGKRPHPRLTFVRQDIKAAHSQAVFILKFGQLVARQIAVWIETDWLPSGAAARRTNTRNILAQYPAIDLPGVSPGEQQLLRDPVTRNFTVFFTPVSFSAPPKDGQVLESIPQPLACAALLVALATERKGFATGDGAASGFSDEVKRLLRTAFPQANDPDVQPQESHVRVGRFPTLAAQLVKVKFWNGFDGVTPVEERIARLLEKGYDHAALRQRSEDVGAGLTKELNDNRALPVPAYLTPDEIAGREDFLGNNSKISPPVISKVVPEQGTARVQQLFEVTYNPVLREATADAKYSPDKGLLGGATYTVRNRFGVGDELHLGFDFGEKRQEAEAYYQTKGFKSSIIPEWHAQFGLNYAAGDESRFGQGDQLAEIENTEVALNLVGQFLQPDPLSPSADKRSLLATPRVGWNEQKLTAVPPFFTGNRGYRGFFAGLKLEYAERYELETEKPAQTPPTAILIGRRTWRTALDLENVWPDSGSNFLLAKAEVEIDWQFGHGGQRDYLVGVGVMGGLASEDIPLSRVFRSGGADWLRGLDEGEILGRRIGVLRLEGGTDPFRLLSGFGSKTATSQPAVTPSSSATARKSVLESPFLLVAAAEYGRASGQDLNLPVLVRRSALSYSLGIDYQGSMGGNHSGWPFQLRLGYAWSPEGLHRSGRVYTSYRLVFPVRTLSSP